MENNTPKQQLASPEGLAWVRGLMETRPDVSRSGLAKAACTRLNWTDNLGRPKEMACRKALVQLERQGAIVLPAARRAQPAPRLAQAPPAAWPEVTAPLAELGTVELKPVRGGTDESRTWNALMDAHHPLRSGPLCGAQIRYLIISEKYGVLGGLAVSACAWRLSARDEWLGWDDAKRNENLSGIVCNSRFLILPTVRVKHLASRVLARLTRRIAGDWRERYGLSPWLMETYVDAARSGTSYRAANWIEAGMTAGRGRQDSTHKTGLTQKRVFLYPLCQKTLRNLRPEKASRGSEEGWLRREFGGARLGDPRLERRLLELGRDFFARPMANIPQACGSTARAMAAYRFFDNTKVTMDALLEPHRKATIDRMRREPVALVAQDSSSLNYTTHRAMEGIGPIGTTVNGPQGLILHSAMVFRPDGLPLGILHADCKARDPEEFGKKHERARRPIEEKESYKWIKALDPIREAAGQCPETRVVTVADREADIYEFFHAAQEKKLDLLVRARLNRKLAKNSTADNTGDNAGDAEVPDETAQRLQEHLEKLPEAGRIELSVPRHGKQEVRIAKMSVRYAQVSFAPPAAKAALAPIPMWVVWTTEISPPKDAEPLEWFLLTTVPIASLDDAAERILWYARRWGIEVFHRILKSGCEIEDRQLGTVSRLKNCLAIDMVIAWRIHHLTHLGRATPELPCTIAFDDDQWKAVLVFTTGEPAPETPPTLKQMILIIAQLGGFLGRKSDGEPGTQTLWRGLQRMDDIAWAVKRCLEAYAMRPSAAKNSPKHPARNKKRVKH